MMWRQVTAEQYDKLIATPNMNKADPDVLEARSVGEALSALKVADDQEEDRHPERFTPPPSPSPPPYGGLLDPGKEFDIAGLR
jgi:hypothetical protein